MPTYGAAFSIGDTMKDAILAYAKTLKIEYVGIAPATPDTVLLERLLKRRKNWGVTPFEEADIEIRTDPGKTMPGAKSILVCLFPYENGGGGAQNVSKYARIPDYHQVVMAYLEKICDFIRQRVPDCRLMPFADNGPLADKHLAYLAGLGFWGRNTLLINPKYGSYCFIGYIITDLVLEADVPMVAQCKDCGACANVCPGQAIGADFDFCAARCVSYITQAKEIGEEQREILKKQESVYGCDLCQEVCPYNRDIPKTPIPEFANPLLASLEKDAVKAMSNRAFRRVFCQFPFSWRGKDAILKNFDK